MKLLPFTPSELKVEAKLEVQPTGFSLSFEITGSGVDQIVVQNRNPSPSRKLDLWKETCFECFFGVGNSKKYYEFNGSTSGDWALYSFENYRSGMKDLMIKSNSAPVMEKFGKASTQMSSVWRIPYFTDEIIQSAGITAVMNKGNDIEYWALKHSGEKPDFHLRESFIYRFS